MYKTDNEKMLELFQSNNEIRFFYTCCDIVNAGKERYGVKKVEFYTPEKNKPDFEYVEFIDNIFNMLFVSINTTSNNLIEFACEKITKIYNLYDTVQIGVNDINLIENDTILKYFNISEVNKSEYGVYALLSNNNLLPLSIPDKIEIALASLEQIEKAKKLDNEEWDALPSMLNNKQESDLLILLHDDNVLSGYLYATCRYKNFYDIANVFVHESYRGNGFGTLLTVYYANYCLNNGFIPHYGSAISKYSENIALKSGFEETSRSHFFTITIK